MENVIVAVFCIALVLIGAMTIAQSSLNSTDTIAEAWKQMENTSEEISRTNIASIGAVTLTPAATTVKVTLENTGETKLEEFDEWDVIVQYRDTNADLLVKRLSYTSSPPGNNEWTVDAIYLDASTSATEVFDPGIFNPDEDLIIRIELDPAVGTPTANLATIATHNGVATSAVFTNN